MELCSRERYRPLESDIKKAEVYRLGFCRFIRLVLQSLRCWRLSESTLSFQSEQNVRSGFGLSGHRLSRSLLGGDTLVRRQPAVDKRCSYERRRKPDSDSSHA